MRDRLQELSQAIDNLPRDQKISMGVHLRNQGNYEAGRDNLELATLWWLLSEMAEEAVTDAPS